MFKLFAMIWRGIKNALFEQVSPELMAEEAKNEVRTSTLETVEHAQAAETQAVRAERMLAQLIAEREKARLAVKRALKVNNEIQANLFAEQVARLDQRIATAKERVERIAGASKNARMIATQRVQQMAEDGKRMIGLLRENRNEAFDRLKDRAERHTAESTAAGRVVEDILAGSAAQAEMEMRTASDEAENVLAEVRAELGIAPRQTATAAPPDDIDEDEGEDFVKNVMRETV